jgi:hypothetical protein
MTTRTIAVGFAVAIALVAPSRADEVWTGRVKQNSRSSDYTVVMRLSGDGGETEYPELKCGGKLTRVAQSGDYSFYLEKITTAGIGCIDGAITLVSSRDAITWGWVGTSKGETYVAWSSLTRKCWRC